MTRLWIGLGAFAGLLARWGWRRWPRMGWVGSAPSAAGMLRNALQMQGWHALALLVCGLWAPRGGWLADAAGAAFVLGLVLFCGAVYTLAIGGVSLRDAGADRWDAADGGLGAAAGLGAAGTMIRSPGRLGIRLSPG